MPSIKEILEATKGNLIYGNPEVKIRGVSIDSRTIKPEELFIAVKGNNFDGHDFINEAIKRKAKAVLFQNSNSFVRIEKLRDLASGLSLITVSDTIKALGDIARHHRSKFNIPIIAVTGSNGKTTTKEIIAHLLGSKFIVLKNEGTQNNQIGIPLTLLKLNKRHEITVLELATNHFGEIGYLSDIAQANIAVLTNIGPSHLEFLNDLEGVFKEKVELLNKLNPPRLCLLNSDDKILRKYILSNKEPQRSRVIFTFGLKTRCDFKAQIIGLKNNMIEFLLNKERFALNTPAPHNVYNALAAILLGRVFGLSYATLRSKLKSFEFLKGRLARINLKNNIEIIDDTYNSNPLSISRAIDVLEGYPVVKRKIFVMGDMLELGRNSKLLHSEVGHNIAHSSVSVFFTLGEFSKFAAETAKEASQVNKIIRSFNSRDELNKVLLDLIRPQDVILIKGSRAMKMDEVVYNLSRNLKT